MVTQSEKFCRCVYAVKSRLKGKNTEGAAIAICTKSMLFPKGRTIKKLTCGKKGRLITQKRKVPAKK